MAIISTWLRNVCMSKVFEVRLKFHQIFHFPMKGIFNMLTIV